MRKIENLIDKDETNNIKYNVKLFPVYYMFAADYLFFYAIEYVFLAQVKGFSGSQILLLDAMIPLFCLLLDIPLTLFVEKHGKRKSLVVGNICMCICLILMMISTNLAEVIIAFLFNAIGFCFKGLTETNILAESINMKNSKGKSLFAFAYSSGYKNYMILDGITSFFIGLTFAINGYVPIIISLMFIVIATFLSSCFKITEREEKERLAYKNRPKKSFIKEYKKEVTNLKGAFLKFVKSRRLRALMLFIFLFSGLLYSSYSVRETLLVDYYNIDASTFGLIIAGLTIVGGLSEILQEKIQKIFKNRTFTFISMIFILGYLAIYGITLTDWDPNIKIALTLFLFALHYCSDSLYKCFQNTYQKNFTTNRIRVKISSVFEIIRFLSEFSLALLFSVLVEEFEITQVFLYIGAASLVIFILALLYMRKRFGLRPEQYDKSEIFTK